MAWYYDLEMYWMFPTNCFKSYEPVADPAKGMSRAFGRRC